MFVVLDRERLEAALIQVPAASASSVGVPTPCVRKGEPSDEAGKLVVLSRPDDHVPVIGHDAVGQQPCFGPFDGFL
jgi:hypothetical protein